MLKVLLRAMFFISAQPKVNVKVLCCFREDTDELAAFRSRWKEELGIGSRVEGGQHGNATEREEGEEEKRKDSNYSTPGHDGTGDPQQSENDESTAHTEVRIIMYICVDLL